MPRLGIPELKQRIEDAWGAKRPYYSLINECWRYAAPGLNPYRGGQGSDAAQSFRPMMAEGNTGDLFEDDLFDSTLSRAAERHANRLVAEGFPAGHNWGTLVEGPEFQQVDRREKRRREALARAQASIFGAIHASDFYLSTGQMAFDTVVSGTGLLKVGGSPDPSQLIGFEPVNQAYVALEGGPRSQIWGYHRRLKLRDEEVFALWPESKPLRQKERMVKNFLHTILDSTYFDPRTGIWYYDVLEDFEEPQRIFEEDLLVSPWIGYRYKLMTGEVQGRSPVMVALPDARTTDHAIRTRLEAASIRAVGAYTYRDDAVFNPRTVRLESGALIQVGSNDAQNPTISPLELAGDIQLNELVLEDLRNSIDRTLLNEALPPATGAVRSATEIIERQKEAMLAFGGPFQRLMEEVGRPVLRAVAYQLARRGELPEIEAISPTNAKGEVMPLMLDGTDIGVRFDSSPLSMAQSLADAETTARWADMSQAAAGPAAWMGGAIVEDIPAVLNEKLGAPPELVRAEEQRQAQMQQAMQGGEGAPPPQGMAQGMPQ